MEFLFREFQAGQFVAIHGPGIQADFIFHDKGFIKGSVAENDLLLKAPGVIDKRIPDPEQVLRPLIPERHTRSNPGMHHIIVIQFQIKFQTSEKSQM